MRLTKIPAREPTATPAASPLLVQRACACGGRAGVTGECEECRMAELAGHGRGLVRQRVSSLSGNGRRVARKGSPDSPLAPKAPKPPNAPAAPPCHCTPPLSSPCRLIPVPGTPLTRADVVRDAFLRAQTWCVPALAAVDRYITSWPRSGSPRAEKAFKDHFGWPPKPGTPPGAGSAPAAARTVLDNLILHHFKSPVCPDCPPCTVEVGDKAFLHAFAPTVWKRSNCYEFCPPFFGPAPEQQSTTVLHEMMHSWEDMGDVRYEVQPGYPPPFPSSVSNADSHAGLIRDLRSGP